MATFYLDYEGGNDANDGLSFANRWKTITSGATAARTAPGDTIRVMASPEPTSLGINATWTGDRLPAAKNIQSSTNAAPISMRRDAHGWSTGETVIVNGHSTNTNANGVWEITVTDADNFTLNGSTGNGVGGATGTVRSVSNCRVALASALTQTIASTGNRGEGRTAWTQSANVTASLNTSDFKEGDVSDQIAIAVGFTTGLAAYKALGAAINMSGYRQVAFWIKQTSGTVAIAGDISLRLCSDTVGAVTVDTIAIPALGSLNRWLVVVVDKGAALGASIQSVALYVDTDRGAQTFLLSNIIGCKNSSNSDSLTLASLISKNTTDEYWWGIQSIKGTRVMLDRDTNSIPAASPPRGYYGNTATVETFKRETIKTLPAAASSTAVQAVQESGSSGSLITYSGGWNRTDMSTQTGQTYFDGLNGNGNGIDLVTFNFLSFDKLNFFRYASGLLTGLSSISDIDIGYIESSNCSSAGVLFFSGVQRITADKVVVLNSNGGAQLSSSISNFGTIVAHSNQNNGVIVGRAATITEIFAQNNSGAAVSLSTGSQITLVEAKRNDAAGLAINGASCDIVEVITENNLTSGISLNGTHYSNAIIRSGSSAGNVTGSVVTASTNSSICLRNFTSSEAVKASLLSDYFESFVIFERLNGVVDSHEIHHHGGIIATDSAVTHGAAGLSWRLSPTSLERVARSPLRLPVARVACAASALVTIKAWLRRNDTGLTLKLVCVDIEGSSVSSSMTAGANVWEELTVTLTPSEKGVVQVFVEAYGGTTYSGWVDDMTISQA